MLLITRDPISLAPLPRCAFACCLGEALVTLPQSEPPHGWMTISVLPFFQRPSRLLLASAGADTASAPSALKAMRRLFIRVPYRRFEAQMEPSACGRMNAFQASMEIAAF